MSNPSSTDPFEAFTAESLPTVDPRIGMVIQDRYRIVRKLGAGGMGVVYEGEHLLIKRRVAIKCLHPQFAEDTDALGRFLREALAATSIGNEHIIDVMDLGKFPDGSAFMVLEFLDGRSLSQELQDCGPLPLGKLVHIASQICDALSAAHAKGVVHRDLKPDNIFLLKHGSNPDFVKVLDFGISKIQGDTGGAGAVKTRTGLVMGTLHFMPPEQLRAAKDMDHRVDIYALGVIIFRALTGRHPFEDDAVPMLAMKIISWPAPSVRELRPDVPPEFDRVLQAVLAKDMHERPSDCATLKRALAPFAGVADAPVLVRGPETESFTAHTMVSGVPAVPQLTPIFGTPAEIAGNGTIQGFLPSSPPAPSPYTTAPPSAPAYDAAPPRRSPLIAAAAGAAVLILVAGVAGVMRHGDTPAARPTPDPARSAAVAPTPVPSPAPQPPAPQPAAVVQAPAAVVQAPAAANVRVQIQTNPEGAEVFLDGDRIPNPFDGELPHSATARRLEARLPGYTSVVQDLTLNFPQTVRIRLSRGHGVEDHRAHAPPAPGAPTPPVVLPSPTPPPTPPPTPASHATPPPTPPPSVVTPPAPQGIIENPF